MLRRTMERTHATRPAGSRPPLHAGEITFARARAGRLRRAAKQAARAAVLLCCVVATGVVAGRAVPGTFGYRTVVVPGTASTPGFSAGDAVLVRPGDVLVGDVIAYRAAGRLELRAVVAADGSAYEVAGSTTAPVPAGAVIGVVRERIRELGLLLSFASNPWLAFILFGVPALAGALGTARVVRRRVRRRRSAILTGGVVRIAPGPPREANCPFCERHVTVRTEPATCPSCGCPLERDRVRPIRRSA